MEMLRSLSDSECGFVQAGRSICASIPIVNLIQDALTSIEANRTVRCALDPEKNSLSICSGLFIATAQKLAMGVTHHRSCGIHFSKGFFTA
jgi:hypothetical protein